MLDSNPAELADITCTRKAHAPAPLDRVGMERVEMPLLWPLKQGSDSLLPAQVDVFVSLEAPHAKGIHMSRLYNLLKEQLPQKRFSSQNFRQLAQDLLESQEGLSGSSSLKLSFQLPLEREALVSGLSGWRSYPVQIYGRLEQRQWTQWLRFEVLYSSTCPCSAALAQQVTKQHFLESWQQRGTVSAQEVAEWLGQESSLVATAHAQRSQATVEVQINETESLPELIVDWIDLAERALGTPVQTAVKRQDEQEFARLNAAHLMFCEDAARKIREAFEADSRALDYRLRVEHLESLHPHNAVAEVAKGKLNENNSYFR